MKKIFVLGFFLIIIASLVLTGCQSTPATTTQAPAPTTQAPAPTTQAPAATTSKPPAATTQAPAPTTSKPAATTQAPASTGTVELTFSYHAPPEASLAKAVFEPWAKEIETASNGRIKITRYPGGTLVKASDAYDAVATGLCDIAQVDTEETPGRFPVSGSNSLSFFYPSTSIAGPVTHELLNRFAVNSELKEVKLLMTAPLHPSQYFGNKPVKTLEDLAGMKLRASGKIESSTVDVFKGVPVNISTGDLFSALDKKTIDGCFFTYSGALAFGIKDAVKYCTQANTQIRVHIIAMNKAKYDKLPADLKQIIDKFSTVEMSYQYAKAHEAVQAGAKGAVAGAFKGAGKDPIYELPADEIARWKAAVKPTWDAWASDVKIKTGIDAGAILSYTQDLIVKYSK